MIEDGKQTAEAFSEGLVRSMPRKTEERGGAGVTGEGRTGGIRSATGTAGNRPRAGVAHKQRIGGAPACVGNRPDRRRWGEVREGGVRGSGERTRFQVVDHLITKGRPCARGKRGKRAEKRGRRREDKGREAEGMGESGGRPQELFRAGESDEKNGLAMNAAGKKARERRNAPVP